MRIITLTELEKELRVKEAEKRKIEEEIQELKEDIRRGFRREV